MKRIELTISTDYVPTWGAIEGIREFVQNALDQEVQSKGKNTFKWTYNEDTETLSIGSLESALDMNTLLLGTSTKQHDCNTIGQFGEGYKLGCLVLIRAGYSVNILNYGKKEIWHPHLVKSRRFGATILVFDIEHVSIWQSIPNTNLSFVVKGIKKELFTEISHYILPFNKPTNVIKTDKGSVLLDEDRRGEVYVNGLYVNSYPDLCYGYDIPAQFLALDRDRHLAREFDVSWATSAIWALSKDTKRILQLVSEPKEEDTANYYLDARYLQNSMYGSSFGDILHNAAYQAFLNKYGDKAVPVCSQSEAEEYKKRGYITVLSSASYTNLIRNSANFACPPLPTISERLADWYKKLQKSVNVPEDLDKEFEDLVKLISESYL